MNQRFLNHIKEKNLFTTDEKLLLALSGGVDSMVLFHLLRINDFNFSVAHVNHSTRDGESDTDAAFVEDICQKFRIPCHAKTLNPPSDVNNFQAYAREARYKFFSSLGHDKILTAHHSDDNLETVLLHFFTGRSTRPIPEVNRQVVRPLLAFGKQEIRAFAEAENIAFVEDSSNQKNTYDRNFIRNRIIPELDTHFPNLKKRILQLSQQLSVNDELLNQCATELLEIDSMEDKLVINKSTLGPGKSLLLYHAIKPYGFNQQQSADIIENKAHTGIQFFSETHRLVVDRETLIIALKKNATEVLNVNIEKLPVHFTFNKYKFTVNMPQGQKATADRQVIYCNKESLGHTLHIRTWQDGDIFYPAGMHGHSQSLKKYFANNKLDRIRKSEIPIVCTSDQKIIWITGYRQDERFVSRNEADLIEIRVTSNN